MISGAPRSSSRLRRLLRLMTRRYRSLRSEVANRPPSSWTIGVTQTICPRRAKLSDPRAHRRRGGTADSGVDFVKDQRFERVTRLAKAQRRTASKTRDSSPLRQRAQLAAPFHRRSRQRGTPLGPRPALQSVPKPCTSTSKRPEPSADLAKLRDQPVCQSGRGFFYEPS